MIGWKRWAIAALLAFSALQLTACTNPQAVGERYVEIADASQSAIETIDEILADYPEGSGEPGDLLVAIESRLSGNALAEFRHFQSQVGDARTALRMVRDDVLVTLRDEAQVRAEAAFEQAAKEAEDLENLIWSVGEIAAWAGGPTAIAILSALGLFRERRRTEDIVTSLNDSKSVREAIKGAGDVKQSADTQRRVKKILRSVQS